MTGQSAESRMSVEISNELITRRGTYDKLKLLCVGYPSDT